jgi:predicted ATPase
MIVRRISCPQGEGRRDWPFGLAPIAQVVSDGLEFTSDVTFFVGENGSGKSTVIEAIAEAYGMDSRTGDAQRRWASPVAKSPLGELLVLDRDRPTERKRGYFLRAETAHGFFEYVTGLESYGYEPLTEMSHGESFLTVLQLRFRGPGLYLMDEVDTPLSFRSTLGLMTLIDDLRRAGAQVICATHSPVLSGLPGASVLEFGEHGIRAVSWKELELVDHHRRFLANPDAYLRHVLDTDQP